ncbi:MAG: sigma-70 family RNA polymerase sigma factor [Myxococcales bacterium]|nr:sigma-70 family RNA polymerase sigma factor [Myxococcales bacterium]
MHLRYHPQVVRDEDLLEAWRSGDEDAGVALFERHYDGVARFFKSKAWDASADLIQRTFLACLETRDRMRDGTSFRSYLFGIARNILFEHYRGKRRDGRRLDFAERSLEDLGATPTTALARAQESQLLLQGLRRIPLEHQMILELYYWEEMTAGEIAGVLEVPEGTARTRIRRAKQLLEGELKALATTPQILQSTVSDLDSWASQLRNALKER